jgi:TetR/AcrR family transcriptional regulator
MGDDSVTNAARLDPKNSQNPGTATDLDNRSRLLQAATDNFAEFGYEGASLRAIADSAGVSFQLIAYYFGSKEELWIATVDFLFERYLETGKGLGFTSSGNLAEQFHNHLRLLLTDMLQRPQLRKIWIQEYLADSPRYHNVIRPKIRQLYETLSVPYFKEVVRLGIVERFTAAEIAVLWSAIVQNNVVYPYYIELMLGLPAGSPKSVEKQVDLVFGILTEKLAAAEEDAARPMPAPPRVGKAPEPAAPTSDTVVYAWKEPKDGASDGARLKQLEIENLHLKQLVGNLSLEKKLLLERLAAVEPSAAKD